MSRPVRIRGGNLSTVDVPTSLSDMGGSAASDGGGLRSGGDVPAGGLARWLSEFARDLQAQSDEGAIMQAVVRAAVGKVPGAECASITLITNGGAVATPFRTDDLMSQLDGLQFELGEGPCLSAAREHLTVRSDDLRSDQRWPKFGVAAAQAGAGSMLCLQLFAGGDSLGALNLVSRVAGAFDDRSEDVGLLLAAHAAIVMIAANREGVLTESEHGLVVALASEQQVVRRLHVLDGLKYTVLQTLAHDLRSPIAAVLTLTGVLRFGLADDRGTLPRLPADKQLKILSDIERSVHAMERLLQDLISSDPLPPIEARRERCDVGELVARVLADNITGRSHPIHTALDSVTVNVDATQIERVVDNLLNNAAKHLDVDVPIWIHTEAVGAGVLITVDDAGPGVPTGMEEEIFEPFRRGQDTTTPGLGLGLSLVARYAQVHGGRAWVEQRQGGGASFRVYLPDTDTLSTSTPPAAPVV